MRSRTKATAVVMAGAVALSSAAYGIGTQAGGGTAAAENGNRAAAVDCGPGMRFGFRGLAEELGVDAAELRAALEDFRQQNEGDHRDAFAAALADALGKSTEDVQQALESMRPGGGDGGMRHPFVSLKRLAAALDVTRAELRDALREARSSLADSFEERHAALVTFLAERFNLSEEKVEEALPDVPAGPPGMLERHRPGPGGGPPGFGPGGP